MALFNDRIVGCWLMLTIINLTNNYQPYFVIQNPIIQISKFDIQLRSELEKNRLTMKHYLQSTPVSFQLRELAESITASQTFCVSNAS